MKLARYTPAALRMLAKLPKAARPDSLATVQRNAETGAGSAKALVGRPGARLRIGDYRAIVSETADAIEVFAVGARRDVHEERTPSMSPQIITTEAGEELVVLTRRAYDALLARQGDEAAEDRMTARMTDDHLADKESGGGADIPHWFAMLVAEHGSPVTAARKHHGRTQAEMAQAMSLSQGHLSDIERGCRQLSDTQRRQIASYTGVEAGWLF